jgi:hypothetical protein
MDYPSKLSPLIFFREESLPLPAAMLPKKKKKKDRIMHAVIFWKSERSLLLKIE